MKWGGKIWNPRFKNSFSKLAKIKTGEFWIVNQVGLLFGIFDALYKCISEILGTFWNLWWLVFHKILLLFISSRCVSEILCSFQIFRCIFESLCVLKTRNPTTDNFMSYRKWAPNNGIIKISILTQNYNTCPWNSLIFILPSNAEVLDRTRNSYLCFCVESTTSLSTCHFP